MLVHRKNPINFWRCLTAHQLRQFQRVGCDQDRQTGSENGGWMAQAGLTDRVTRRTGGITDMRLVGLTSEIRKAMALMIWWFGRDTMGKLTLDQYHWIDDMYIYIYVSYLIFAYIHVKLRFTSVQMEAWYCWFYDWHPHNHNYVLANKSKTLQQQDFENDTITSTHHLQWFLQHMRKFWVCHWTFLIFQSSNLIGQGSLNYPYLGIKQCKRYGWILNDLSIYDALFGLMSYNDPCWWG